MGAVSVANRRYSVLDNKRVVQADVTFSASYATGGDTVSPAALGLLNVTGVSRRSHQLLDPSVPIVQANLDGGVSVHLAGTAAAPLLKCYTADGVEQVNATNQATVVETLVFVGV